MDDLATLQDLVGEHMLDAVDFSNEQGDQYESCQVMRFRLDGTVYVVMEDPEDGYRSHMDKMTIAEDATMKNTFFPVKVIGRHRKDGNIGYVDDVLELIDAGTGKVVLEIGTEKTSEYYPCFLASFHPEAMTPNAEIENRVMPDVRKWKARGGG